MTLSTPHKRDKNTLKSPRVLIITPLRVEENKYWLFLLLDLSLCILPPPQQCIFQERYRMVPHIVLMGTQVDNIICYYDFVIKL